MNEGRATDVHRLAAELLARREAETQFWKLNPHSTEFQTRECQ